MYKEVLRSMEGVELFPSISLLLFFGFFIALVIYLIKTGKESWKEAALLPLENEDSLNIKTTES